MKKEKQIIFLKGRKTILRPPKKETDLENAVSWLNDQEVRKFVSCYLPISFKQEEGYFNKLGEDDKNIHFSIDTLRGKHIGFMGIHGIDWLVGHATTGALIGDKNYWGKGYGTDAKMLLLEYAFHSLNFKKLKSSVISYNKRSIAYSLHCGYKEIGRRKCEFFREGKYWDEVILEVFREEWELIRKNF